MGEEVRYKIRIEDDWGGGCHKKGNEVQGFNRKKEDNNSRERDYTEASEFLYFIELHKEPISGLLMKYVL